MPGVLAGLGSRSRRLFFVGGKPGRGDIRRFFETSVVSPGTEGSNRACSSGESDPNLTCPVEFLHLGMPLRCATRRKAHQIRGRRRVRVLRLLLVLLAGLGGPLASRPQIRTNIENLVGSWQSRRHEQTRTDSGSRLYATLRNVLAKAR